MLNEFDFTPFDAQGDPLERELLEIAREHEVPEQAADALMASQGLRAKIREALDRAPAQLRSLEQLKAAGALPRETVISAVSQARRLVEAIEASATGAASSGCTDSAALLRGDAAQLRGIRDRLMELLLP